MNPYPERRPLVAVIDSSHTKPSFVDAADWVGGYQVPGTVGEHVHGQNTLGLMYEPGKCRVFAINVLGSARKADEAKLIAAIDKAVEVGADIIQMIVIVSADWASEVPGWDQPGNMPLLNNRIAGTNRLFIHGAGNEKLNLDNSVRYPVEFSLPNQLTVGGVDESDQLWDGSPYGSNYSATKVHIAAPSVDIPLPAGGTESGTSYAAPQATRYAVQLLYNRLGLESQVSTLKDTILTRSDLISGLPVQGQRRLAAWYPARQIPVPAANALHFSRAADQRVEYPQVVFGWQEMTVAVRVKLDGQDSNTHDLVTQWDYGANPKKRSFVLARTFFSGRWHFEVDAMAVEGSTPAWGQTQTIVGRFKAGEIAIFVDGVKATAPASGTIPNHTVPLIVGDQYPFGNNNLGGSIGDGGAKIWNVALSDAEIQGNVFNAQPGAVAWSDPFDPATGPTGPVFNGPLQPAEI